MKPEKTSNSPASALSNSAPTPKAPRESATWGHLAVKAFAPTLAFVGWLATLPTSSEALHLPFDGHNHTEGEQLTLDAIVIGSAVTLLSAAVVFCGACIAGRKCIEVRRQHLNEQRIQFQLEEQEELVPGDYAKRDKGYVNINNDLTQQDVQDGVYRTEQLYGSVELSVDSDDPRDIVLEPRQQQALATEWAQLTMKDTV